MWGSLMLSRLLLFSRRMECAGAFHSIIPYGKICWNTGMLDYQLPSSFVRGCGLFDLPLIVKMPCVDIVTLSRHRRLRAEGDHIPPADECIRGSLVLTRLGCSSWKDLLEYWNAGLPASQFAGIR